MQKYIISLLILMLCACNNGGGGDNYNRHHGININKPISGNDSNTNSNLTDAEKLFGQGQGISSQPTDLLSKTDDNGFEFLTFGAWGKTYDLVPTHEQTGVVSYKFTDEQQQKLSTWTRKLDVWPMKFDNHDFKGPATMLEYDNNGSVIDSDYGTIIARVDGTKEIGYGVSSDEPQFDFIEFHMKNHHRFYDYSDNTFGDKSLYRPIEASFSQDFNNMKIDVWFKEISTGGHSHYSGYGTLSDTGFGSID